MKNQPTQPRKPINKRNLKRFVVASFIFFGGLTAYSQIAVTDASATAIQTETKIKIVQQLKNAIKQTENLQNMLGTAKKNLQFIEEINSEVKNAQRIKNVVKLQSELINDSFNLKKKYRNVPILEVSLIAEQGTNNILESTKQNLQELTRILSTGTYKMNDSERLTEIRLQESQLQSQRKQLEELKQLLDSYSFALQVYQMKK